MRYGGYIERGSEWQQNRASRVRVAEVLERSLVVALSTAFALSAVVTVNIEAGNWIPAHQGK